MSVAKGCFEGGDIYRRNLASYLCCVVYMEKENGISAGII